MLERDQVIVSPLLNEVRTVTRREATGESICMETIPYPSWLLFRRHNEPARPTGRLLICPIDEESTRIIIPNLVNMLVSNDEKPLPLETEYFRDVRLNWNVQNNHNKTEEVQMRFSAPVGVSTMNIPIFPNSLRQSGIKIPGTQRGIRYEHLDEATRRIIFNSAKQ